MIVSSFATHLHNHLQGAAKMSESESSLPELTPEIRVRIYDLVVRKNEEGRLRRPLRVETIVEPNHLYVSEQLGG